MDTSKFLKKLEKIVVAASRTKEISVGDTKLTLRLLTSSEEMQVQDAIAELEGLNFLLKTKHETLSHAISHIDGEEIPSEVEDGGIRLQKASFLKSKFLTPLPQTSIDSIFQGYLVLQLESQEDAKSKVKFENSDLLDKYLEDQNLKKAQDTLDKIVESQG